MKTLTIISLMIISLLPISISGDSAVDDWKYDYNYCEKQLDKIELELYKSSMTQHQIIQWIDESINFVYPE